MAKVAYQHLSTGLAPPLAADLKLFTAHVQNPAQIENPPRHRHPLRAQLRRFVRHRRRPAGRSQPGRKRADPHLEHNNGERFITYAIRAERGSRIISVNGSAARRAAVGDLVIIAAFAQVDEDEVQGFKPQLVFVDPDNRIKEERSTIPVQMA